MIYILCTCIALAIRSMIGLWGYSGMGKYPMFGDFEAQRHWMEITVSLPLGDWYRNTPQNDLQYWGLDYPPLTAYVSWLFGKIAQFLVPPLVDLQVSRGHESVPGKSFMRGTVLLMDVLVFMPAILFLYAQMKKKSCAINHNLCITEILSLVLAPGIVLIDHGHFQYNGVCIGFALMAAALLVMNFDCLGSIFFCLSLNFKQMSLYYAPVFFFSLLRKSFVGSRTIYSRILHFCSIGLTVIAAFALLWFPFCLFRDPEETCVSSLLLVLQRQFPFSRGIFEDKVANIWYSTSVIVDWRMLLSNHQLVLASLSLTLILLFPTIIDLLFRPLTTSRVVLALVNSSLTYFLASFQVHEKSILLALVPASFLISDNVLFIGWFQLLGAFTMYPLLKRDGLAVPYAACCILYVCILVCMPLEQRLQSASSTVSKALPTQYRTATGSTSAASDVIPVLSGGFDSNISVATIHCSTIEQNQMDDVPSPPQARNNGFPLPQWALKILVGLSCSGMLCLHGLELFIKPPARYPDLYPCLFSIFGACNFVVILVNCVIWQHALPPLENVHEPVSTSAEFSAGTGNTMTGMQHSDRSKTMGKNTRKKDKTA